MTPFPQDTASSVLIAFVDRWAALLEAEDYEGAYRFTEQDKQMGWTPELIRGAIKSYGDAVPTQIVTVLGKPTDITQRKDVTRWTQPRPRYIGDIHYDLNIDGYVTDLTAVFWIAVRDGGIVLELNDIHVL